MSSEPHLPAENEPGPEDVLNQLAASEGGPGRQVWVMYPESPSVRGPTHATPLEAFLQLVPEAAWQGRGFLGLGALIGIGFGLSYLLLADTFFVVTTLMHVERRQSVTQAYDPVRSGYTFIATQAEVISSPRVVRSTLESIGLPEPRDGWFSKFKALFRPVEEVDRYEVATRATVSLLQATPVVGTEVMAVTYRTDDPNRGVVFLGTLIEKYRSFLRDGEMSAHQEGLVLLRRREAELAARIADLGIELEQILLRKRSIYDVDGLGVHRSRLQEHARGLVAAEGQAIRLANRLAELQGQRTSEIAQDQSLLEELRVGETALAELTSSLSERHPDVRQARQRVVALRAQVASDARATLQSLDRDLRAARSTQEQLAESYDREWEAARVMEMASVEVDRMRADIARLEQQRLSVADLLAGKELRVLELDTERTETLISVLEPPTLPADPVWPLPGPVLVGCAFVGALGGFAWAIVRYMRRSGVLRTMASTGTRVQASEI